MDSLENNMNDLFGKKAPQIPESGRKTLVEFLPWIALVFGILQLLSAWWLFAWARTASGVADYANALCNAYGNAGDCAVDTSRWTVWIYIALAVMVVDAVLLLMAFPGLRDRVKKGWNLLFYSALLNVVYAIVSLFMDRGGIGTFIWSLLVSAVGFWILFQVRSHYTGARVSKAATAKHVDKPAVHDK